MKRADPIVCLLCVFIFVFAGCAAPASPSATAALTSAAAQTVEATVTETVTPAATPSPEPTPTPVPSASESPTDEAETPIPMMIQSDIPDGFVLSDDESSDDYKVYRSDVAAILLAYERTSEDTDTPAKFLENIQARLPEEEEGGSEFTLVSAKETTFESHKGYVIVWKTGSNEDTFLHTAQFVLTDNYIYRIQYSMSATAEKDETPKMKAFFKSVMLEELK